MESSENGGPLDSVAKKQRRRPVNGTFGIMRYPNLRLMIRL